MKIWFKKLFFSFLISIFFSAVVFAKDVTVQIVQHGGNTENVGETAMVLEDELLNSFFDAGYIVTNLPATMAYSDDENDDLNQKLFSETAAGGGDYAVQVRVYVNTNPNANPGNLRLVDIKKIEWQITTVKTGQGKEGAMPGPSGKKVGVDDSIRAYALSVSKNIVKSL